MLESYHGAKGRCLSETDRDYAFYGGRGIQFRLGTPKEFLQNMQASWFKGGTLERIDNEGHYEYGNIRWATRREQCLNTRNARKVEFNGVTKNLCEWAEELGISPGSLAERIDKWGVERALITPKQNPYRKQTVVINGREVTLAEVQKALGISRATLLERLQKWPLEKALTTPKLKGA